MLRSKITRVISLHCTLRPKTESLSTCYLGGSKGGSGANHSWLTMKYQLRFFTFISDPVSAARSLHLWGCMQNITLTIRFLQWSKHHSKTKKRERNAQSAKQFILSTFLTFLLCTPACMYKYLYCVNWHQKRCGTSKNETKTEIRFWKTTPMERNTLYILGLNCTEPVL